MGFSTAAKVSIVGVVGIVILSAGILQHALFPQYYKDKIKQKLTIRSDSSTFNAWVEPSVPIYIQFYFFSTKNSEEVAKNFTPILQQLGPYTFRERFRKDNISFEDESSIVSYYLRKWYYFVPDMSSGNLSDLVTIPNIPLLTLADKTEGKLYFYQKMAVNNLIRTFKTELFVTYTVEELLFTGYEDHLMIKLSKDYNRQILPDGRFAFYYKKNGTGSHFAVNTGAKDSNKLTTVVAWTNLLSEKENFTYVNYQKLEYWYNDSCNSIRGTDGSQFSPSISKDTKFLDLFATDLCRSVHFGYEKETRVEGVPTLRFIVADHTEGCYCKDNGCYGTGLLNLKPCKNGAPIVISSPHFYDSDPKHSNQFPAMKPNKDEHETFLDVEPTTGLLLRGTKRLQVNIAIKPYTDIRILKDLPTLIYPLFWINESVVIPTDKAEKLKSIVVALPKIAKTIGLAALGIGTVIILLLVGFLTTKTCTHTKTSQKLKVEPIPPLPSNHYIRIPTRKQLPSECLSIVDNDKNAMDL